MKKLIMWLFFAVLIGSVVMSVHTKSVENARIKNEYKRMLYISDLEKEVNHNLTVCEVAFSDSHNKNDSIILRNMVITNFVNLVESDFTFGSDASDRWQDIKRRLKLNGFLKVDQMETEVPAKNISDVYDIFNNIKWLLDKAKTEKYNFKF